MSDSIVIQKPALASRLVLLYHGVGARPESMMTLGRWLADNLDRAMVVAVAAPFHFDMGEGLQWFSIHGVNESNRLERISVAMPRFVESVYAWQKQANVGPENTAIIGFSQGAIMALSSTQLISDALAKQVVSLSGRFALEPQHKPEGSSVHFLHGKADQVIPVRFAEQGHSWLEALGASSTLDTFDGLAHSINHEESVRLLEILQG
ncbi:putative hydrolase [Marinomonas aquimarina]|uniref:Putative hydrolase n=1 Tax=Marinomonas aquimarina TaxID=295068 RepID=A0A1A8TQ13_9GAMM|nr:esterase [Marinomonas aquimarina]SBS34868.1 putative hydrolase [Marinomonas aquimarina]